MYTVLFKSTYIVYKIYIFVTSFIEKNCFLSVAKIKYVQNLI